MKYLILLLSVFLNLFLGTIPVFAQTDECADKSLTDRITCYSDKLSSLSEQSKTLSNQIAQFNVQIQLTTAKISQTEDEISLLGGRIDQLEGSLDTLTQAFASRAVETYKMARFGNAFMLIFSASDLNQAVTRFHSLQVVQESDRTLMQKWQMAQTNYKSQKTEQETLQIQLNNQKADLNNQKLAKNALLSQTKNSEQTYQQLLAQAEAELASLANFTGSASLLSNQTFCDDWGCYYNQRDSQWGTVLINGSNDCNGPCNIVRVGCLVTSVSILASHLGHRDILPPDIATSSPDNFSVGTALLNRGTISVKGVNITRTTIANSLSPDLVAGGPVIVGINYGPFSTHFLVIKSYQNGTYIMNDPYAENGHDVPFTDHYSLNSIFDVERVTI
ncbi:MAG: hypothetical protein ABSA43_01270 [Candidatus Microgenomates bacterium]|jgi:peptidoglycan hydrolase CwlO-like protein